MRDFEDAERITDVKLQACRRCGCNRWETFTRRVGCYVTAFAFCDKCAALYFSSGGDLNRDDAIRELCGLINGGDVPSVP